MTPTLRRRSAALAAAAVPFLMWGAAMAGQAPALHQHAAVAPPGLPGLPSTPDGAAREAAAAAVAAKANIDVLDGWTRATPGNATMAAVYLRIASVKDPDRLIGAKAAMAEKAEIHTTTTAGGTARMAPVASLPVGGGQTVAFTPAGNHIMLSGLKAPLRQGESFLITLDFEKAGPHTAVVRVGAANAMAPPPSPSASRGDMTSGATQNPPPR